MKKKVIKVCSTVFIIGLLAINLFVSFGFSVKDLPGSSTGEDSNIEEVGNGIINIIATVGSIISVITLIVLGIKYMLGSTEEKAEYKKTLLPYIIGATCVFAASTLASVIYNIAINI